MDETTRLQASHDRAIYLLGRLAQAANGSLTGTEIERLADSALEAVQEGLAWVADEEIADVLRTTLMVADDTD